MDQQQFIDQLMKFLGQPVEVEDPTALDQCMDWAFKGCDILGIDRAAIRHQYAYQVWKNPNDQTVIQFEFIPNTPNGVPQAGDLPIFDQDVQGVTGIAGHICWATGEGDVNSFKSLDQNWAGVQKVTEETHSYVGVLGWLRPRIFRQQLEDGLRNARDINYNNLQAEIDKLNKLQVQFDAYKTSHPDSPITTPSDPQPTVPSNEGTTQSPQPGDNSTSPTVSQKMNILALLYKWLIG